MAQSGNAKMNVKGSVKTVVVTMPKVKEEVKSLGVVDMHTIGIKDSITNNKLLSLPL